MSDLTGKFGSFEEQITAHHTELMDALNTIAFALGAPPTGPFTTLDNVITAITQSNTILAGIRSDNVTFHAAMLELAGLINTNTDTIINNNSLNAQRTIAAIYATFCDCATDTPLLGPPLDVTPTEIVNDAKCRRIQFYLSVFGNWLNKIANYGASGAAITGGTLAYLLSIAAADAGIVATGAEVGAAGGIPGVVVGAVVGLIVVAVYTFGGSVLIDYANQFADVTLRHNMVMAMYAASNADEGYTAFKATLLAGMDYIPAQIIYTLWWSAWSNDVYSGVPTVDDSAFDGSICAPADEGVCYDVSSEYWSAAGGMFIPFQRISGFEAVLHTPSSEAYSLSGDHVYSGAYISGSTNLEFIAYTPADTPAGTWALPATGVTSPGNRIYLHSTDNTPFMSRVCILS